MFIENRIKKQINENTKNRKFCTVRAVWDREEDKN